MIFVYVSILRFIFSTINNKIELSFKKNKKSFILTLKININSKYVLFILIRKEVINMPS